MLPKLPQVLAKERKPSSDITILSQLTKATLPSLQGKNLQNRSGDQEMAWKRLDSLKARPPTTLPPLNNQYREKPKQPEPTKLILLEVDEATVGNSQKKMLENIKVRQLKTYQILREDEKGKWIVYDSLNLEREGELPKEGLYTFVRMESGEMRVWKSKDEKTTNHYMVAEGKSVLFAGEIYFNAQGDVVAFNNQSGCYRPPAELAHQAGLPLDCFEHFSKKEVSLTTVSTDSAKEERGINNPVATLYDAFKNKSHICNKPECEHCEPVLADETFN